MQAPEGLPPVVTQKRVAEALGLTQSAISRALRNDPSIPPERCREIQSFAEQMGYSPNPTATTLAHYRRTSKELPVQAELAWLNLWPDPARLRGRHREFDAYYQGARLCAEKLGYRLEEFTGTGTSLERLENILITRGIQGILLPPHPFDIDWHRISWDRFSAVRFGRSIKKLPFHIVTADQVSNTMLAFEKMRERGYNRIGFLSDPVSNQKWWLYEAGFLMARAIYTDLRISVHHLLGDADARKSGLKAWLRTHKPEAVLTPSSEVPTLIRKAGYRIPDDIGVASLSILDGGVDSGIDQNSAEIGRTAVLTLISMIMDRFTGIPPFEHQTLIKGQWVDGTSLPWRQPVRAGSEEEAVVPSPVR